MMLEMGAIKDLWESERGLVAILLIVACTVLCAMTRLTIEQWLDYTKWIFLTYAAAKTVTGTATIIGASKVPSGPSAAETILTGVLASLAHKPSAATDPQPNNPPPPDHAPVDPAPPATTH